MSVHEVYMHVHPSIPPPVSPPKSYDEPTSQFLLKVYI